MLQDNKATSETLQTGDGNPRKTRAWKIEGGDDQMREFLSGLVSNTKDAQGKHTKEEYFEIYAKIKEKTRSRS